MISVGRVQLAASDYQLVSMTCILRGDHNVHSNGLGQIPRVSLYGLDENAARPASSKGTLRLACGIREPYPFLTNFHSLVNTTFQSNGPMPSFRRSGGQLSVRIMDLRYSKTDIAHEKITLRGKGYVVSPKFDASDLYQKYKDFSWTTEFPLERLCISEPGIKDFRKNGKLVRTGYRDIASVPLPGVSEDTVADIAAKQSMEQSEKAYKTHSRNFPVCPLVIPSTPTP